jgi:hypothetical protein
MDGLCPPFRQLPQHQAEQHPAVKLGPAIEADASADRFGLQRDLPGDLVFISKLS